MQRSYYVRYGQPRHVGLFHSAQSRSRGDWVVIKTGRGTELGEVLQEADSGVEPKRPDDPGPILRPASTVDLDSLRQAPAVQSRLYAAFKTVFDEAVWPLQIIDVEPTLDHDRAVLYYLGPHRLDFGGLKEAFRAKLGLEVAFEPVGKDADPEPAVEAEAGCGSCGSTGSDCGSGGGCGSEAGGCSPRHA